MFASNAGDDTPAYDPECQDYGNLAFSGPATRAAPGCSWSARILPPPGLEDACMWQPVHRETIELEDDAGITQEACTWQTVHQVGHNS